MPDSIDPQVGVAGASPDVLKTKQESRTFTARPFVRVEISSSEVPKDASDKDRRYRFVAGIPIGENDSQSLGGATSAITITEGGSDRTLTGSCGLSQVTANDSFNGQNATLRFHSVGTASLLARRIRAFDRIRIDLVHPSLKGAFPGGQWPLFDGVVRGCRGTIRAGGGDSYSGSISISGAGLNYILSGAIYNWQQQIHPDEDVLGKLSTTLASEAIGQDAAPAHKIIKAFLRGALGSTMSLRIGDANTPEGIGILDYFRFGSGVDWSSAVFNSKALAYPIPWILIQQQSGQSFWNLIQAVSEPLWHELFVGMRLQDGAVRPVLIHRPRPFPGLEEFDDHWKALNVVKLGTADMPGFMDMTEEINADRRPNCFHWAGLSLCDQSRETEYMKQALGFCTSDALVNRFGYSSVGLRSKLAPITEGSPVADLFVFAKKGLNHYARQEMGLPFMKTRNIGGVFLPVRPGDVLEDHTLEDAPGGIATGYVTSTSFSIQGTSNGMSLSMSADVERVLLGVDAERYPARVRELVKDIKFVPYAGKDLGPNRQTPSGNISFKGQDKGPSTAPGSVPDDLLEPIKAAAARQGIPAWVIAHVLQNESGMGKNMGSPSTRLNGIAQITASATGALLRANYTNPDGTAFSWRDKGDRAKSVHACAAFLKITKDELTRLNLPSSAQSYWSWVVRGYRWGVGSTIRFGQLHGWTWPANDLGDDGGDGKDYFRYWHPDAIKSGQQLWGYLG